MRSTRADRLHLLDVNCLVALAWPNHVHHARMVSWFRAFDTLEWATTASAQHGFLRVSMNRAVTGTDVTFAHARAVLSGLLAAGSHRTVPEVAPDGWPDWLAIRIQGYRQVTDASLVAAAVTAQATLVTLDAGVQDLTDALHRAAVMPVPY